MIYEGIRESMEKIKNRTISDMDGSKFNGVLCS